MRWMITRISNFCSLGQLAQKKQLGGSMLCRMLPLRRSIWCLAPNENISLSGEYIWVSLCTVMLTYANSYSDLKNLKNQLLCFIVEFINFDITA